MVLNARGGKIACREGEHVATQAACRTGEGGDLSRVSGPPGHHGPPRAGVPQALSPLPNEAMAVVFPDFALGIFATKKAGMDLTLEYFHVFHHVSFTHRYLHTSMLRPSRMYFRVFPHTPTLCFQTKPGEFTPGARILPKDGRHEGIAFCTKAWNNSGRCPVGFSKCKGKRFETLYFMGTTMVSCSFSLKPIR